jgi:hypothetical protein
MSKSLKSRREALAEARQTVQRQIEILEGAVDPWGRRSVNHGAIAELRRVLDELNDSLAERAAGGSDVAATDSGLSQINQPVGRRHLQPGDLKAIAILAALGLFLLSAAFVSSLLPRTKGYFNWGFGPDWTCTDQSVEASCLRKP